MLNLVKNWSLILVPAFVLVVLALMVARPTIAQVSDRGVIINLSEQTVERFLERLLGTPEATLGAQSGPDHYGVQYFHDGHLDGGVYKATTTAASATALVTDILTNEGYVRYWNMNVDNAATVTLPATSSLAHFIPDSGDCWLAKWENSGDSNLTVAAGTGIDLQEPDDTSDFNVVIGANGYANVEYCRTSNSDIVVTVMETSVAD